MKARRYWFERIQLRIHATLHSPSDWRGNLFAKLNLLSNKPIYCLVASTYCMAVMPLDKWSSRDSTARAAPATPATFLSRVLQLFDVCECLLCFDPLLFPQRGNWQVCPRLENKEVMKKKCNGVLHLVEQISWLQCALRTHHVTGVTTATAIVPPSPAKALD